MQPRCPAQGGNGGTSARPRQSPTSWPGCSPRFRRVQYASSTPALALGTLSAAICQRVLRQHNQRHLIFDLFENDPKLIPLLETTMTFCKKALRDAGHEMSFVIRIEDFILAHTEASLFDASPQASFQLAILNPPYFKVRKESKHARAMAHVVHGQPNIYAFSMAVVADLLWDGGGRWWPSRPGATSTARTSSGSASGSSTG